LVYLYSTDWYISLGLRAYIVFFVVWAYVNRKYTYKYNTSVDNTTIYLYTKIMYIVRATCFDFIGSKHVALTKYTIFVYK